MNFADSTYKLHDSSLAGERLLEGSCLANSLSEMKVGTSGLPRNRVLLSGNRSCWRFLTELKRDLHQLCFHQGV